MSRQTSLSKTVSNGGAGSPLSASQKVARPVRNCLPDTFGSVNQNLVIELVDEEPTEEMISARERFWDRVFVELLPAEEEGSVKAKRKK
jgi:hypothetical protein